MILKLEVNKVTPGSYEKNGKTYQTLDLLCTDKGDGRRLGHSVLFSPDRTQRELIETLDLRDRVITCDIEEVKLNFAGAVVFRGFIDTSALPAVDGKLKTDKGAPKAPALAGQQ